MFCSRESNLGSGDVLSDALEAMQVSGTLYYRARLTAPWGIGKGRADHMTFYAVLQGACWLRAGDRDPPVPLAEGDVVLLPHGHPHGVSDAPDTPLVDAASLAGLLPADGAAEVGYGGGGAAAVVVAGKFAFRHRPLDTLLAALPAVIHLRRAECRTTPWLDATLQLLAAETAAGGPGGRVVTARLADILFVQTVRAWVAGRPPGPPDWLRGLFDSLVGRVLGLMHQAPGRPWTVASLAKAAAVSRSSLAARFRAVTGRSPMAYLTGWRLQSAAGLLRATDLPMGDVALRVGYRSEVAFKKAFKRGAGVPPGQYRRAGRA